MSSGPIARRGVRKGREDLEGERWCDGSHGGGAMGLKGKKIQSEAGSNYRGLKRKAGLKFVNKTAPFYVLMSK